MKFYEDLGDFNYNKRPALVEKAPKKVHFTVTPVKDKSEIVKWNKERAQTYVQRVQDSRAKAILAVQQQNGVLIKSILDSTEIKYKESTSTKKHICIMREYVGFTSSYSYCTICDKKV
jgi:hypothetical protein